MNTLGNKIRVFRKLKGFSQLDLELAIGASTGSLSRIENNDINPTKETVMRLAEVLNLTILEYEYLIGSTANAATQDEIKQVREYLKNTFNDKMFFGYLIDDRDRFIDISKGFKIAASLSDSDASNILMQHFPKVLLEDNLGIRKHTDPDYFDEIATYRFLEVYQDMYFMEGDLVYENMMEYIRSNKDALKYWQKAADLYKDLPYRSFELKKLKVNMYGIKFTLEYSVERLVNYQRFRVIEFRPNNHILKFVKDFSGLLKK